MAMKHVLRAVRLPALALGCVISAQLVGCGDDEGEDDVVDSGGFATDSGVDGGTAPRDAATDSGSVLTDASNAPGDAALDAGATLDGGDAGGDSGAGDGGAGDAGAGDAGGDSGAGDAGGIQELNGCTAAMYTDLSAPGATRTITNVGNTSYMPKCMTIAKGQTVTFNVNFTNHPLAAGNKDNPTAGTASSPITATTTGTTKQFTFANSGTFPYICTQHSSGAGLGMAGSIYVKP